jgi:hypothetical protein
VIRPNRGCFNHVLKSRLSTHGCQHMVETIPTVRYACGMPHDFESIVTRLVEGGHRVATAEAIDDHAASLAALQFADTLRRSADRLSQESAQTARRHGASWREIGEAVGGITPQGAEHRFSSAAKERRSKASKVVWAAKERRVATR